MDKNKALELWQNRFGHAVKSVDFTNDRIHRDAYNDKGNPNGWCIHHKQPISKGGNNDILNLEIVSMKTHDLIKDQTTFKIKDDLFEVHQIQNTEYAIFLIIDDELDERVDHYDFQ